MLAETARANDDIKIILAGGADGKARVGGLAPLAAPLIRPRWGDWAPALLRWRARLPPRRRLRRPSLSHSPASLAPLATHPPPPPPPRS